MKTTPWSNRIFGLQSRLLIVFRDNLGRLHSEVICIDAVHFEGKRGDPQTQYGQEKLLREINKVPVHIERLYYSLAILLATI